MRRKVNAITFRLNYFSRNMLDSSSTKRGCPGFVYVNMCLVETCSVSPTLALCSEHMCLGEACFVAPTLVLCFDIDSRAALRTSQPPFGETQSEWKTISNGPAQ